MFSVVEKAAQDSATASATPAGDYLPIAFLTVEKHFTPELRF